MRIRLSAPSKTFLSGEYAVLQNGPAIVLNTHPRFTLSASRGDAAAAGVSGIPEGSPAWQWLDQRKSVWQDWNLQFADPHGGLGGFGASGAQFLLVHAFTTFLQISVTRATQGLDLPAVLHDYQALGSGSGVDILAQATGQVAMIERAKMMGTAHAWPYPELSFAILRTQQKVATHEHLKSLSNASLLPLVPKAQACFESFGIDSAEKFLLQVKDYASGLRQLGLQAATTVKLLEAFAEQPWCKAAKGCGALGADTVLIFFAAEEAPLATAYFAKEGLEVVGLPETLSTGLELQWSWQ